MTRGKKIKSHHMKCADDWGKSTALQWGTIQPSYLCLSPCPESAGVQNLCTYPRNQVVQKSTGGRAHTLQRQMIIGPKAIRSMWWCGETSLCPLLSLGVLGVYTPIISVGKHCDTHTYQPPHMVGGLGKCLFNSSKTNAPFIKSALKYKCISYVFVAQCQGCSQGPEAPMKQLCTNLKSSSRHPCIHHCHLRSLNQFMGPKNPHCAIQCSLPLTILTATSGRFHVRVWHMCDGEPGDSSWRHCKAWEVDWYYLLLHWCCGGEDRVHRCQWGREGGCHWHERKIVVPL